MAANKFATMLQKNCHKITVILVYAVLEWILILLLLLNSLFSYLIANFAKFFGLKPSCTWCSSLDHRSKNNSHFDHVCEAHGTQISSMSYCSTHNKLAEAKNLCNHCSSSRPPGDVSSTVAFFTWMSGLEGGDDDRCSCCDQMLNRKVYPQSMVLKPSLDVILEYLHKNKIEFEADLVGKKVEFEENGSEDDNKRAFGKGGAQAELFAEECVSHDSNLEVQEWDSSQTADDHFWNRGCNEDDESVYIADMLLQNAESMDSDRFICIELIDTTAAAGATEMQQTNTLDVVEVERDDQRLEGRTGSDVDTIESPSRVTREDEEQNLGALSREIDGAERAEKLSGATSEIEGVVKSLKSTVEEQEKALSALYAELEEERRAAAEAAKETMAMITKHQEEKAAMQTEAAQYQRMMEEQAEYDQEALQLLNDLMLKREKEKKELEKELEAYRTNQKIRTSNDTQSIHLDDDDDDDSRNLDDSLEECITSLIIPDISLADFDEERVSILEQLKVLESKLYDEDAMAKKLLPLFDAAEADDCHKELEISSQTEGLMNKMLIQEELGHVYERLHALEADKEFLEHCIRSMMKGNQGMGLLQEILQHLRDLKSVELLARNIAEIPLQDASMEKED